MLDRADRAAPETLGASARENGAPPRLLAEQTPLSYAVVTAARDEAPFLPALAEALALQTIPFGRWVIVDDGSADGTREIAAALAARDRRVTLLRRAGERRPTRGEPIARSLEAGLELLRSDGPDVVVVVDCDVTIPATFFESLLARFAADSLLGIASGTREELTSRRWRPRPVTGTGVQAQCRAYRSSCLQDVLPLERHMAWDTVDEVRARLNGWRTASFAEPRFRHHRRIGARDDTRAESWLKLGATCHYLGYRPSYVVLRAVYRASREPAALAMLVGFASALRAGQPRADERIRRYVRSEQRARALPARMAEALGMRTR